MKSSITLSQPIIDRLAWKLDWRCSNDRDSSEFKRIKRLVKKEVNAGNCEWAYLSGSKYCINFHILFKGESNAFVQMVAVNPLRQTSGLRIECNPAKMLPEDIDLLHQIMSHLIGNDDYECLMLEPLIQVFHVAVDINGLALNDVLVQYKNAQLMTVMAKRVNTNGIIEGYNFGSVSSNYQTTVYDKRVERIHRAALEIAKKRSAGIDADPLTANRVRQLKKAKNSGEITRVEVRGKRMLGLPLWKLSQQTNRFERFSFFDLAEVSYKLPPHIEKSFLALCRQDGVKAALSVFQKTEYARRIPKYWRSHQAVWWKPEELWMQAFEVLKESRIFVSSAFNQS